MALNFNNLNASEQLQFGTITTPLFANGAITSNKFGTTASVIIQDITYTAVNGGVGGNAITIQYIENGIAGLETVEVTGTAIVVNIGNHTVLGSTATQVQTAITTSFAASLLVNSVITGTPSNIQLGVSATHLTGGITGAAMVTSLHADSSPLLVGAVQLVSGTNITLSQSGQVITVNSTGELSQTLTNNHIFVGNGSNIATDVTMSGDATIIASGTLTLANTAVTPAFYTNTSLTVDSKGRIISASSGAIGNLTDTGTDGITVTGGTGSVMGSGTSISQHVADTTHNGYLSSTDWNTFSDKQPAGSYITALTGDATATGPGSVALTLATVNVSPGSTTISSITTNGKGLVTSNTSAATTGSGNVVLATSPSLTTPALGTPSALVLTHATGQPTSIDLTNGTNLSLTTGITGILPVINGGSGTATPSLIAGTNITITGSWPNQTVNSTGGGGTPAGSNTQIQFNNSSVFGASSNLTFDGTNLNIGADASINSSNGSISFDNTALTSDGSGNLTIVGLTASGSILLTTGNVLALQDNGTPPYHFNISAPARLSYSYSIFAPLSQAAISGQSLVNDALGNLSWGGIVARIALTGQNADISATTLYTPSVTGLYQLSIYFVSTGTDAGSANPSFNLTWTDDSGSTNLSNGAGGFVTAPISLPLTPDGFVSVVFPFEAISSQPIQYSVTGGGYDAGSVYSLYVTLTQL